MSTTVNSLRSMPEAASDPLVTSYDGTSSSLTRARTEASVALALRDMRDSLGGEDCACFPTRGRSALWHRGREIASLIGNDPYGGMAIFGDSDDGQLELIIDSVGAQRRVSILWREDDGLFQVIKYSPGKFHKTPWTKRVYGIESLAQWIVHGTTDTDS